MVVFPVLKIPSMVVSLYTVILLVVGNPMYGKPLTVKYILANDSSVLNSIIYINLQLIVSVLRRLGHRR